MIQGIPVTAGPAAATNPAPTRRASLDAPGPPGPPPAPLLPNHSGRPCSSSNKTTHFPDPGRRRSKPARRPANVLLERPKVAAHGDVATNVAMQAGQAGQAQSARAGPAIVDALMAQPDARALVESAEIAGPGFINLRVTPPRARPSSRRWPSRAPLAARRLGEDPGRVRVRQPHRPAAWAMPARPRWATPSAACTTPAAGT